MYKQGDIIAVNYPFSDNPALSKLRPAIVISNILSNNLDNDLLIAPITSILRNDIFSMQLVDNQLTISLPENSEIRCNKITTLRKSLVIRKISALKPAFYQELLEKIILALKPIEYK
jgi:mRNA interferase MazF